MKISVLGCGRWGSFLAWYINSLGHEVVSFGPDSDGFRQLCETRKNEYVEYDSRITLTCDLETAVSFGEIIIIAISAQGLRGFLEKVTKIKGFNTKKYVLCMKGIEEKSLKRLSQVAIESGISKNNIAVWVGPGHIQDFVLGIPNCMLIDSYDAALTQELTRIFKSQLIRFYYGNDIIGTEIGAATKNIMGIVAGILDGVRYSTLKGPLMARGAREVARLIKALGGNELSAYGLCHLGDYETTLFSLHSHNRKFGELFAKNERFDKLAEGVATAKATAALAKSLNVDMPITSAVNSMLHDDIAPLDMLSVLFERDLKGEFNT